MNIDLSPLADLIAERLRPEFQPDEVLTTQEAADLLKLSAGHVSDLARCGDLPGVKLGRDWRFSRRALLALLTDNAPTGERQSLNAAD